DARVRGVHQPQAYTLSGAQLERLANGAVHRHSVADAAVVARIHEVGEILDDAGLAVEPPVAEHPHLLAIDRRRLVLLDDERCVQTAADLARAAKVWVIPVRAGVAKLALVEEAAALRRYRRLRQSRDAVHRARQP